MFKPNANSRRLAIVSLITGLSVAPVGAVELVDFVNGTWIHNGVSSVGWDSNELVGTYLMGDGNSVTMTVSFAGSATPTADNLSIIDETFFSGFAFQVDPATTSNLGESFVNYQRIDFEFANPVDIEEFVITDFDRSAWDDTIFAEAWDGDTGVGLLGTGVTSSYGFRDPTNIATEVLFGESHAVVALGGNTVSGPESDLFIDFDSPVTSLSLYYWNGDFANTADTQTIGILGNVFSVTTVPEPSIALMVLMFGVGGLLVRKRPR